MLATQLMDGLARIGGVELLTPKTPAMRASMVTFRSSKVGYDVLFGRLLKDHAMRCRPVTEEGLNALRVSTHCFDSPEECERLMQAVKKTVEA